LHCESLEREFKAPQSRYGGNGTRHRIDSKSSYLSSLRPASERSSAICSPPIDAGTSKFAPLRDSARTLAHHDGAQQHLVALSVKVRLLEQFAERDPERARSLMNQLQDDVRSAIEELRSLAHGIYPPLLSSAGLGVAMSAACRRAPLPASLEADGVGRYAPEIEAAVYFCCLEAMQNAAKHAGAEATARVRIWEDAGGLLFEVCDDGAGFEAGRLGDGAGLTNMRDRLGAVGGTLRVESNGRGSRIHGVVPVSAGSVDPTAVFPAQSQA